MTIGYVRLPGGGGGWVETPDHSSLEVGNQELDIRLGFALDNWGNHGQPSDPQVFIGKWLPGQQSFQVAHIQDPNVDIPSSGYAQAPIIRLDHDGVGAYSSMLGPRQPWNGAQNTRSDVYQPGLFDEMRVLITWSGSAVSNQFFRRRAMQYHPPTASRLADDNGWERVLSSQVGFDGTGTSIASVFDGSAPLTIGGLSDGTLYCHGAKVSAACIKVGGVVVANPDFTTLSPGDRSVVDGTGKTWTLQGNAYVASAEPPEVPTPGMPTPAEPGVGTRALRVLVAEQRFQSPWVNPYVSPTFTPTPGATLVIGVGVHQSSGSGPIPLPTISVPGFELRQQGIGDQVSQAAAVFLGRVLTSGPRELEVSLLPSPGGFVSIGSFYVLELTGPVPGTWNILTLNTQTNADGQPANASGVSFTAPTFYFNQVNAAVPATDSFVVPNFPVVAQMERAGVGGQTAGDGWQWVADATGTIPQSRRSTVIWTPDGFEPVRFSSPGNPGAHPAWAIGVLTASEAGRPGGFLRQRQRSSFQDARRAGAARNVYR